MKFLHTADLHIGRKIFEQSLIEDQKYILDRITEIAFAEQVDAVVIAGDIYDRSIPSTEAVTLLDNFLTQLVKGGIPVIAVSGNHDSAERVAFADRLLEGQGLYLAGGYQEPLRTVTLEDEFGPVTFVCLPFVKPAEVGAASSAEAVEEILSRLPMTLDLRSRYVLVTHFFVTGESGETPELSDSENDSQVGGLDSIPAGLFQSFSYVALGHIHKPQHMGMGKVYYAGSPLKYSFSEAKYEKSVNIVELGIAGSGAENFAAGETLQAGEMLQGRDASRRGCLTVRRIPLTPLRDMRCIKGALAELISPRVVAECSQGREDYLQVTLTDTEELIDPMGTLRSVYPNVLQIIMEKNLQSDVGEYESRIVGQRKGTAELFGEFYELLKGEPMDEKRRGIVEEVADAVGDRI